MSTPRKMAIMLTQPYCPHCNRALMCPGALVIGWPPEPRPYDITCECGQVVPTYFAIDQAVLESARPES